MNTCATCSVLFWRHLTLSMYAQKPWSVLQCAECACNKVIQRKVGVQTSQYILPCLPLVPSTARSAYGLAVGDAQAAARAVAGKRDVHGSLSAQCCQGALGVRAGPPLLLQSSYCSCAARLEQNFAATHYCMCLLALNSLWLAEICQRTASCQRHVLVRRT